MFKWFWRWVHRQVQNSVEEKVAIRGYGQPEAPSGNTCTVEVADGGFVVTRWNPKTDRRELFVATNEGELIEKINVALVLSRLQ